MIISFKLGILQAKGLFQVVRILQFTSQKKLSELECTVGLIIGYGYYCQGLCKMLWAQLARNLTRCMGYYRLGLY